MVSDRMNHAREWFSSPTRRMTVLVGLLTLALLVSWFAYSSARLRPLKSEIATVLATDASLSESLLRSLGSDSAIQGELISLCEKNISTRQDLSTRLRSANADVRYDLRERAIEFINAEIEVDRAFRQVFESIVTDIAALDAEVSYLQYMVQYRLTSQVYEDTLQGLHDKSDKADAAVIDGLTTLRREYDSILEVEQSLQAQTAKAGILFTAMLAKYKENAYHYLDEWTQNIMSTPTY